MQAIKLKAIVDKSRELRLLVPEDIPEGPVEVVVLSETSQAAKPRLSEVLRGVKREHKTHSRQELDSRIGAERDSWE
jgi:hypothetical protein